MARGALHRQLQGLHADPDIGDVWYIDAGVEVDVERALERTKGSLGGVSLSLSATNITNKLPDWSTFFRGYDVFNYDLIGRALFVRLKFQL
jgi:outer membrane receptor protein involved in Fe transport